MNICICVTGLNYAMGGVSTHILDLCKHYSKTEEIDKIIVCADGGELVEQLDKLPKVHYYHCNFWQYGMNPQGVVRMYKILKRIVRNESVDIIHVHSQRILMATHLIKIRYGIPYLWTNHIDAIPMERVFYWMCKLMKFPIISVSDELRNMMIDKFKCDSEQVSVVNNGIDLEQLEPLQDSEKKELEKKYKIDKTKTPYVLCLLSRIWPVKGHKTLLQAIENLNIKTKSKLSSQDTPILKLEIMHKV